MVVEKGRGEKRKGKRKMCVNVIVSRDLLGGVKRRKEVHFDQSIKYLPGDGRLCKCTRIVLV